MIRQKTALIGTTTNVNTGVSLSFEAIQVRVNQTADSLLDEINEAGNTFVSLQVSHMPECTRHLDRIFVTVVFRENPTRKVLTEKTVGK